MKIVCLCPTYGRHPDLLRNTLACFMAQTYKNSFLFFYDDLGNIEPFAGTDWGVISTPNRSPHLPHKYHTMLQIMDDMNVACDAVAIWDDDDVYLPHHLQAMADTLQSRPWSKPSYVFSTYGAPEGETALEPATGRFHGSMGIRLEYLRERGGWPQSDRATFDQEIIKELDAKKPGDPLDKWDPSYVYRWADTGAVHCSGLMGDPQWYAKVPVQYDEKIHAGELSPAWDRSARGLLPGLGLGHLLN